LKRSGGDGEIRTLDNVTPIITCLNSMTSYYIIFLLCTTNLYHPYSD
jgi:hypothetical protein